MFTLVLVLCYVHSVELCKINIRIIDMEDFFQRLLNIRLLDSFRLKGTLIQLPRFTNEKMEVHRVPLSQDQD